MRILSCFHEELKIEFRLFSLLQRESKRQSEYIHSLLHIMPSLGVEQKPATVLFKKQYNLYYCCLRKHQQFLTSEQWATITQCDYLFIQKDIFLMKASSFPWLCNHTQLHISKTIIKASVKPSSLLIFTANASVGINPRLSHGFILPVNFFAPVPCL